MRAHGNLCFLRLTKLDCFFFVQQGTGYSGYHGGEFVNVEGEHEHAARMAAQGESCMSDGEVRSSGSADKRPLNKAADDAIEPEAKRQHVMATSPNRYMTSVTHRENNFLWLFLVSFVRKERVVEKVKICSRFFSLFTSVAQGGETRGGGGAGNGQPWCRQRERVASIDPVHARRAETREPPT